MAGPGIEITRNTLTNGLFFVENLKPNISTPAVEILRALSCLIRVSQMGFVSMLDNICLDVS